VVRNSASDGVARTTCDIALWNEEGNQESMWKPNQPGSTPSTPEPARPASPVSSGSTFEAARPAAAGASGVPSGDQATIGKSLVVKGELSGSESLYIDGKVEGAINLPGNRVTVGPQWPGGREHLGT